MRWRELACAKMGPVRQPRLLIGGLGMGFTLAAALKTVGPDAEVVVAELVPEVVEWNRTLIGAPAGHPLDRSAQQRLRRRCRRLDSPKRGRIRRHSDGRRQRARSAGAAREQLAVRRPGLRATRAALRPRGVLAVWSASPDRAFSQATTAGRLRRARARRAPASRGQGTAARYLDSGVVSPPRQGEPP